MAGSRREVEAQRYPLAIYLGAPVAAIALQSIAALYFARFAILDLPLLVTIYFGITGRNPMATTGLGTVVGLAQDGMTHRPIGVNGIATAVIGYLSGTVGLRVDTDNFVPRLLLGFVFTVLHSAMFLLITQRLLGLAVGWSWVHELIRGVVNAVAGVGLFLLLDLGKSKE
jgi:rod shape-determining protein MreD